MQFVSWLLAASSDQQVLASIVCYFWRAPAAPGAPATHHHWPPAFNWSARTLLLCTASGSSAGDGPQRVTQAAARRRPQRTHSEAVRLLGSLPPGVLLHVLELAAEPQSAWMW